jgi:hypothetical protein
MAPCVFSQLCESPVCSAATQDFRSRFPIWVGIMAVLLSEGFCAIFGGTGVRTVFTPRAPCHLLRFRGFNLLFLPSREVKAAGNFLQTGSFTQRPDGLRSAPWLDRQGGG